MSTSVTFFEPKDPASVQKQLPQRWHLLLQTQIPSFTVLHVVAQTDANLHLSIKVPLPTVFWIRQHPGDSDAF